MGWQVAQHITILQHLLKHILALKHSWHFGRLCCAGHGRAEHQDVTEKLKWNLVVMM